VVAIRLAGERVVSLKRVIASILIAAGVAVFFFVFESQEAKIKKQFKFIAEKINKFPGESPILSGAKAKGLKKAIANPCFIHIPVYSYSKETNSDSLTRYVLSMRSQYSEISMTFYDFLFDHMDEKSAQVTVTTGIRGTLSTGEAVEDIHEVTCRIKKIDDVWKFIEIEVVEVLKK
jgi:hypothetical protein